MKKLMFAMGLAALCASVQAVESANIVGYTEIHIRQGVSLFTPAFVGTGDTEFDLNTVTVLDSNGDPLDGSYNELQLNKMSTNNGAYEVDTYAYDSDDGWNMDYTPLTGDNKVTFKPGEGIAVGNETGKDLIFRIAGQVDLVCLNAIKTGVSLWGNGTPVTFYLKDVIVTDTNGDPLDGSYNEIQLNKMSTNNGAYEVDTYAYDSDDGWNMDYTPIPDVTLAPGEGIAIGNETGKELFFTVPSPVN